MLTNGEFPNQVNWDVFEATRIKLGQRFCDHLNYFMEDCPKSLEAIERGIQNANAMAMIVPADRLAEDAELFGAEALAMRAAYILDRAQHCLALQERPDELLHAVIELRPCVNETLALLRQKASPLVESNKKRRRRASRGPVLTAYPVAI